MRTLKGLLVTTVVFSLVVTMGARSFAGPLLPSFPAVWPDGHMVAGQSKLVNPIAPLTDYINVDWIVMYDGAGVWGFPGAFVYMYQLENTAGSSGIRAFNVSLLPGPVGPIYEVGIEAGDLDSDNLPLWKGHDVGNFSNLGAPDAETEPGGVPIGSPGDYSYAFPDPYSVSFVVAKHGLYIGLRNESLVLYIIDPRRPVYNEAIAQDRTSWWGKVTLGGVTYGDPIPVPSPEPGAAMLLITGLLGTLVWRYRRK